MSVQNKINRPFRVFVRQITDCMPTVIIHTDIDLAGTQDSAIKTSIVRSIM